MKLLEKLGLQVKGVAHDIVDSLSNDNRTAHQLVREITEEIAQAEASLIDVETDYRVVEGKHRDALAEVNKYADGAARAVDAGNDALAMQALSAKKAAQARADSHKKLLDERGPGVQALKARIDQLKAKKSELEQRADNIEANNNISEAESRVAEVLAGIDPHGKVAAFDELEARAAKKQARASVMLERADATGSLDSQLAALGQPPADSVADELAQLKSQRGKA